MCCQTNPQFILSLSGIIKFVLEGKILPRAAYTPKFCGKSNRKIVLAKSFENVKFVLAKIIPVSGSRSSRYQSRSWSSRYRSRFRQSRSSWCRFQFSWYRTSSSRLDLNLNCFDLDLTGIGHDFLGLDLSGIGLDFTGFGLPDVILNFLGIGLPGLISILTVSILILQVSVSISILTVLVQSYRF